MELVRNAYTIRLSCAVWRSYGAAHSGLLERLLRELLYRGILVVGGDIGASSCNARGCVGEVSMT